MNTQINPFAGPIPHTLPAALRKPRLRRFEASQYLELAHGIILAPASLARLACHGGGPAFQKSGATPLYPVVELDKWAAERLGNLRRSTSEG
ncbi:hypothetical protein [Cereibacter azotoformans]|uniref:Uncharacterized protein n=1 Tax=Cereibacter azotoformans TaxID=43057 RepID=A0A2T5JXS1_9RHOB|nr:hypothetical protein [Cereibacter azotoformans]MBO4169694.1 hypothetical protein [Cereibacter azotoformans]PTR14971.1 hypothetical protein C8J28_115116 [Cereibacter azotoformans]